MSQRHPLAVRIIPWAVVVVGLILVVRAEQGTLQDVRINGLSPCGVDSVAPYAPNNNPSLVELTFGQESTGVFSMFDSSLTAADTTRSIFGTGAAWFTGDQEINAPSHSPTKNARFQFASLSGQIRQATYNVHLLSDLRTAQLSLDTVVAPGVRAAESAFATTLVGFEVVLPTGKLLHGGKADVKLSRPLIILTSHRCTLVVSGMRLNAMSVAWRPGKPDIADFVFHDLVGTGGRSTVNLTYLYMPIGKAEGRAGVARPTVRAINAIVRSIRLRGAETSNRSSTG
jgi:hypothetical protein